MNHKHLLIYAQVNKPPTDAVQLNDWLANLVSLIDMKILMGPYSKYLDVEGNRGITGIVVIETSHISCHFWDEEKPGLLQMDVYSCKEFDSSIVEKALQAFEPILIKTILIDRNDGLTICKSN